MPNNHEELMRLKDFKLRDPDESLYLPSEETKEKIIAGLQWIIDLIQENDDYPTFALNDYGWHVLLETNMLNDSAAYGMGISVDVEIEIQPEEG